MHWRKYCFLWISKHSYWCFQWYFTNMNYWNNQFAKEISHWSYLKANLRFRNLVNILHWTYQRAFRSLLEFWSSKCLSKKKMLRNTRFHNSVFGWREGLVIPQSHFEFIHLACLRLRNQNRIFFCLYLKIIVRWLLW